MDAASFIQCIVNIHLSIYYFRIGFVWLWQTRVRSVTVVIQHSDCNHSRCDWFAALLNTVTVPLAVSFCCHAIRLWYRTLERVNYERMHYKHGSTTDNGFKEIGRAMGKVGIISLQCFSFKFIITKKSYYMERIYNCPAFKFSKHEESSIPFLLP